MPRYRVTETCTVEIGGRRYHLLKGQEVRLDLADARAARPGLLERIEEKVRAYATKPGARSAE